MHHHHHPCHHSCHCCCCLLLLHCSFPWPEEADFLVVILVALATAASPRSSPFREAIPAHHHHRPCHHSRHRRHCLSPLRRSFPWPEEADSLVVCRCRSHRYCCHCCHCLPQGLKPDCCSFVARVLPVGGRSPALEDLFRGYIGGCRGKLV